MHEIVSPAATKRNNFWEPNTWSKCIFTWSKCMHAWYVKRIIRSLERHFLDPLDRGYRFSLSFILKHLRTLRFNGNEYRTRYSNCSFIPRAAAWTRCHSSLMHSLQHEIHSISLKNLDDFLALLPPPLIAVTKNRFSNRFGNWYIALKFWFRAWNDRLTSGKLKTREKRLFPVVPEIFE